MNRITLLLFALLCLCTSRAVNKSIVWQQPSTEVNSHIEGYFGTLLEINRVEFRADETQVYMHIATRPGTWVKFASSTCLKVGDKSYPIKSCDGLEIDKKEYIANNGHADVVFHFAPLPQNTKKFDFIEGIGEDFFQILGIQDQAERANNLFPSLWRNDSNGNWELGLYDDCAIYDSRFWQYKQKTEKGGKYTLTLTDGKNDIHISIDKNKKGKRMMNIDGKKATYSFISSIALPDYPQKDYTATWKDTHYQSGDTTILRGWLKDMPKDIKERGSEYFAAYPDLFNTYNTIEKKGKIDSLGRFEIKIPLNNSYEAFFDWRHTFIRTLLEPGETYFLFYDFKEGHKMFMGKNCRLQNETLAYPIAWTSADYKNKERDKISAQDYQARQTAKYDVAMKEMEQRLLQHPTLSEKYRHYVNGHYACGYASALMEGSFVVKDRKLPSECYDKIVKLWQDTPKPYSSYRDYGDLTYKILTHFIAQKYQSILVKEEDNSLNDAYFNYTRCMMDVADSLHCDPEMKNILAAQGLVKIMDHSCLPLNQKSQDFLNEYVTMKEAHDYVMRKHEKLLAIQNQALSQPSSLQTTNSEMKDITDGEKLLRKILEPHKGKIVLIDVWGTWCYPCKQALSHSKEEYERLAPYDIVYLYFANGSPEESWKNIIKQYNLVGDNIFHYNLPKEQQDAIESYLKVNAFPSYRLIAPNGTLLDIKVDARNLTGLENIIKMLKK